MPDNGTPTEVDEQIKAVTLENACLDREIKQLDLASRRSFWRSVILSPAFLTAIISANVAITATAITWLNGNSQLAIEKEKLDLESQKFAFAQLEKAIQSGNQDLVVRNLQYLILAGVFPDREHRLRVWLDQLLVQREQEKARERELGEKTPTVLSLPPQSK